MREVIQTGEMSQAEPVVVRRESDPGVSRRVLRFLERALRIGQRPPRSLRLCESLSLGERRFVAVVEFEQRRFLLGGTGQSLVLLASLDGAGEPVTEEQC